MKLRAKHLFILLLLLSVVIQCAFGNFPFAFFVFPLDALIALLWIAGMVYAYKKIGRRDSFKSGLRRNAPTGHWVGSWLVV